jgi:cephalosporin hydroxylase
MLKNLVRRIVPLPIRSAGVNTLIDLFHRKYYAGPNTWHVNTFLGHTILQCPLDLQIYQELIFRLKPAFILQTGIFGGGSLLYFASILDLMKASPETIVIGVDIEIQEAAKTIDHPRIRMIEGSSTDPATIEKIKSILPASRGMVTLDSDHSEAHVTRELEIYRQFVEVGSYLVVEDTNINGHPVFAAFGPGPYEALQKFLPNNPDFVQDNDLWQRHLFSHHQYGWLKRIR